MYKLVFVFLLFYFTHFELNAQNWNSIYTKEIEAEDYLIEKQYEKAADKYKDALKLMPSNANLSYKVGLTYLMTTDKKQLAIEYLKDASTRVSAEYDPRAIKEENAPPIALFHLGRAYQIANMFDEAINAFNSYKEYLDPNDPAIVQVNSRIESCRLAPELMLDVRRIAKSNLGETINNQKPNFNPVVSGDGNTLAFTTIGSDGYDIYVSRKKAGKWEKPKKITDDLGTNYLKTTSLSFDGNWMYLVDDFDPVANIYDTFFEDGYWVRTKKLKKPVTSKFSETHASISPNGNDLYFSSNRPGGKGGFDIYKSTQDEKGRWSDPINLGARVNTDLNEQNPFITPDGKYLFFSSEGHGSMGGYDVFYTELNGNGEIINLGYPVNNADDNLFFFPLSINRGFVALNEPNGFGTLDIFEVIVFPPINLNGKLLASGETSDSKNSLSITIKDIDNNSVIASIASTLNESFSKKIIPGNYQIDVIGEGIESYSSTFTISDDFSDSNFDLEILLNPIVKESLVAEVVEPIVEPVAEQVIPKEEEKQVEPEKHIIPETKPEVLVTEQPKEITIIKKEEKEKPKEEPKIQFASNQGEFTVQIMALIVPVDVESFKNISGVNVTRGSDGFYRYTVGSTQSKEEALAIRQQLISLGYPGAFVRSVPKPVEYIYSIQIMALKNSVDTKRFSNLENVFVEEGDDGIFRYFVGNYNTLDNANFNLKRIIDLGYPDAFVKKM